MQSLSEFHVVHERTAVADEGDDGMEEIRCLGPERWKGLLWRGLDVARLP
jgi:hypothetical protein